ncbi:ParE family toxin-like protein [Aeromonas rivuli]|uniref:ParE family toxin-like protein n=1 Tax=Aeromonas rivuli TaxID=648794 RepID=UPI003F9CB960
MGRIPAQVQKKAAGVLACQRPRRLLSGCGDVIAVGYRYRLFRPCGAQHFQLMTHERYNKLTARKRRG